MENLTITSLSALFKQRGVTSTAVAETTSIPVWNIGLIRAGRMVPFLHEAQRLAEYFNISVEQLAELCGVESFRQSQRTKNKGESNG